MPTRCSTPCDRTPVEDRFRRFLSDRNTETVTGIRRMGRQETADLLISVAEESGIRVSHPGDADRDTELIVFDYWSELEGFPFDDFPSADIVFGQDLCHQVPAIVRFRR